MFAFVSMNHLFYHQCSLVFMNIVSVVFFFFFFDQCPLLSLLLPLTSVFYSFFFYFFFFCSFFSFSSFLFSYSFLKIDDTYNLWYIVVSLHPYISVFSVVVFCRGLFGLCCIFIFMSENRLDFFKCLSRMPGLLMFIWVTAAWTNTSPPQNKSWLNWSYKTWMPENIYIYIYVFLLFVCFSLNSSQ